MRALDVRERATHFLRLLLREYPQYPSVALFRCWEMALLAEIGFESPLLDLGCGDGRIVEHLLADPASNAPPPALVGLDLNRDSVRLAAARPAYPGAVVADARAMPLRRACVGSVVSICVLEHIPVVARVFDEIARVLRPGGTLAFSVPTPRLVAMAAETHPRDVGYAEAFRKQIDYCNMWEAEEWEAALQRSGLSTENIVGFMPEGPARAWFAANDWALRPIRGRGALYRLAGPGLRRFALGSALAHYWLHRLLPAARAGAVCARDQACAVLLVARRPRAPSA